jgi:hypothetical protein
MKPSDKIDPDSQLIWDQKFGRILRVVAVIGAFLSCVTVAVLVLRFFWYTDIAFWQQIAKEHFLASVGIAGFAITSFGVVVFLRQTDGPIEFEAWGLKFKGAAGQVVLWAFCVLALSLCGKLLW